MATILESLACAMSHHQAGRLHEAEDIYRQILASEPNHARVLSLLGAILYQMGKADQAVDTLRRALELDPSQAEALNSLGLALAWQGHLDDAVSSFKEALRLKPDAAVSHYNLAKVFDVLEKPADAVNHYSLAVQLRPDHADAQYCLGVALLGLQRPQEAAMCFETTLRLRPDSPEAHFGLGCSFDALQRSDEAIAYYRRALQLNPDFVEATYNLGSLLHEQQELDEAAACYRRAVALRPHHAKALSNLGKAEHQRGNFIAADAFNRLAIQHQPDFAEAQSNQAVLHLLLGDFEKGWQEYEWRWKTRELMPRDFQQPTWSGGTLSGGTILLHAEQGLGDTLQFIRYAPKVKDRSASVIVECQKPLARLLSTCAGIDRIVEQGDCLPPFDVHAPLLSLPGIFKTTLETIPATVPYLFADPMLVAYWRERLERACQDRELPAPSPEPRASGSPLLRIGINWRGRAGKGAFRQRDIPLECFAALAQIPAVRLISLHKGEGRDESAPFPAIMDLGSDIDTTHGPFMDTAAIMKNLDLVITSDTAIPHLAGALGVPVWLALPFVPDWRWLLDRTDSPWYPTMRLFRQKTVDDWPGVFHEIAVALHERIAI